jgi:DNA-binding NarL/FixJ family response regulator
VRQGLKSLLEGRGFEISGETDNGRDAITMAGEKLPDVIIMDIGLPKLRGIEAARKIKKEYPRIKIIMLTIHTNEKYIYESLDAGADAYLAKETASDDLVEAINAVMKGEIYIGSNFRGDTLDNYGKLKRVGKKGDEFSRLTNREKEILQHIAEGLTSQKIAEELFLSRKTVDNHRANIMKKLNLHDTASLVRYAVRIGLVDSV